MIAYDRKVRLRLALAGLLACAVLCGVAPHAIAAPSAAEAAFDRGRELLEHGQIDEACAAFAESVKLDFQYGAFFNLATCEERRGNLATALAAFRRIVAEDRNATRAARSREHVVDLESRVARLRVTIVPAVANVQLVVDDRPVELGGGPVPVDPGSHRIVASAPGVPDQRRTVEVSSQGAIVDVMIDLRAQVAPVAPPVPVAVEVPPPDARPRGRTGKTVVAAGAASAAGGLVVGVLALRGWRDAQDRAMTDPAGANADLDRVRLLGNTSTVLVGVGTIAIAVGIYLWRR